MVNGDVSTASVIDRTTGAGALIILPTLNERENLAEIVASVLQTAPAAEILIVDDQSQDGTAEVADSLAKADPRVHVEHRTSRFGLGPAYVHGFQWALRHPCKAVVQMDADFSHRPEHLSAFFEAIAEADLVLGSRYVPGGKTEGWAPHRLALSRGGNLYAKTVLGLHPRDLTGGFKCFRKETLAAIDLGAVTSVGYGFQIEVTARVLKAGFRVVEIPITFPDRTRGTSKMSLRTVGEALLGVWSFRQLR